MSKKIFILDTNVLISDPSSIFKFHEHDLLIPFTVLEELDKHKKGQTEISRNARESSRKIESVVTNDDSPVYGYPLGEGLGRIFFSQMKEENLTATDTMINDNKIILEAWKKVEQNNSLKKSKYTEVVLVSKDINVRIKAKSLGLNTEDYENDYAINDSEILDSGIISIEQEEMFDIVSYHKEGKDILQFNVSNDIDIYPNCFVESNGHFYRVVEIVPHNGMQSIYSVRANDYSNKNKVWGINAKNLEQNLALNLLMDPNVAFVTLLGPAGTGKTILTIAAALAQVFDEKRYKKILITRATIAVGEEIGFLPGTEEEKMAAWMGNMYDNLEALVKDDGEKPQGKNGYLKQNDSVEQVMQKIEVKSIGFMRGRSFQERLVIIDEAQNLSPKEMRMLLTRAGEGTKIVCMGNLAQIDTPYMTEYTSGLTHAVKKMKGWEGNANLILNKTVRSELSEQAEIRLSKS
jgi:PhoH-like ATPase